ncbi:MAG TPA: hypothetical protein VHW24_05945 [Bryobacteraceae bacterium]|nr:hypothetical protein [Bryobacteraceae bacterium]
MLPLDPLLPAPLAVPVVLAVPLPAAVDSPAALAVALEPALLAVPEVVPATAAVVPGPYAISANANDIELADAIESPNSKFACCNCNACALNSTLSLIDAFCSPDCTLSDDSVEDTCGDPLTSVCIMLYNVELAPETEPIYSCLTNLIGVNAPSLNGNSRPQTAATLPAR